MELGRALRLWVREHPAHGDALLAALVLAGGLTFAIVADRQNLHAAPGHRYHALSAVSVLVQLTYAVAVMWRRIVPVGALLIVLGVAVVSSLRTEADFGVLAGAICLYSVARYRPPAPALAASIVAVIANLAVLPFSVNPNPVASSVFTVIFIAISVLIGRNVRTRRAYMDALEERASRAEAERETAARTAVMDERRRIARELHDLVAHHVSVMRVLAEGSRRLMQRDPVRAEEALSQIDGLGREALREMRRILDVLRSDDEPDESPTEPNPGTASLEALVEQVRRAGLPVQLRVVGGARTLPASADLSAYRIVQEALTNTLKHGGPVARAQVEIRYGPSRLEIDVEDNGRGASAHRSGAGHGLLGMRERVGVYGGELTVGPRAGGGFIVHATLPYDTVPEPEAAV